jgi:predicted porin
MENDMIRNRMTGLVAALVFLLCTTAIATGAEDGFKYEIYGVAHVSLDVLNNGQDSSIYLSSNSSRIGFRGDSVINENLKTVWQVECDASLDQAGGQFASRNSYVGLSSAYGDIIGGRHDTAFEVLSDQLALFRDQVGDARNIIGNHGSGWNRRNNNVVAYRSPGSHAVNFFAVYAPEEDTPETEVFSASAAFSSNGLFLTVAAENHGGGLTTSGESETGIRAGASYSMSGAKITGMYEMLNDVDGVSDASSSAFGLGVAYATGKHVFKAQYYSTDGLDDVQDDSSGMIAVGYDFNVAENTRLYLAWASVSNDDAAASSMSSAGRGNGVAPLAGDDPSGVSAGMVYGF